MYILRVYEEFQLWLTKQSNILAMKISHSNLKSQYEKPSVGLLLAVLSWLTTRGAKLPDAATRSVIAHHFHLLVLHPSSDGIDIQAGLYMAKRRGMDAAGLLARYGVKMSLH